MFLVRKFYSRARRFGFYTALRDTIGFISRRGFYISNPKFLIDKNLNCNYFPPNELVDFLDLVPRDLKGCTGDRDTIVWIIPDFGVGSGGHSTIFRLSQILSFYGYKQHFMVHSLHTHHDASSVITDVCQRFRKIEKVSVEVFSRICDIKDEIGKRNGFAIIGTCWRSQYLALLGENFDRRFAFVQDKEGLFRAYDAVSVFSDNPLLEQHMEILTAGPWLASRFENATPFTLGADVEIIDFFKNLNKNSQPENQRCPAAKRIIKIGVYGRFVSPRRAVDLVWLALMELSAIDRDYEFEVHSFGSPLGRTQFPFKLIDHGILSQIELNNLLPTLDIGIAYSATNYSILPVEMIAAKIKTFDVYTEANVVNYGGLPISLLNPLPSLAAREIHSAILAREPIEFDNENLSWMNTFKPALREILGDQKAIAERVSVCIPTYNGGATIASVCAALKSQNFVDIELNIIDSGSSDLTLDIIRSYFKDANIQSISSTDFGHGKTRNDLAVMSSCEHVFFLTQDAVPIDPMLLRSMVAVMKDEECGLVFARHIANPLHGPFVFRDIENHFDNLLHHHALKLGQYSKVSDAIKRFSSDNCALYRKSELQKLPFADVPYGEDQIWARDFLARGGSKCYLSSHVVLHSHDLGEAGSEERAYTETVYFLKQFGEIFSSDWTDLNSMNERDTVFAKINGISDEVLQQRLLFNKFVVEGRLRALADWVKSR